MSATSIRVDPAVRDRLAAIASARGVSLGRAVELLIEEHEVTHADPAADGGTLSIPPHGGQQPGRVLRDSGGTPAAGRRRRVLVLGGARSGKSEVAERRVAAEPAVTYGATGPASAPGPAADGAGDVDWAARVAAHRARRPPWWRTVETTDVATVLREARGPVLIDSMTTWLAAMMDECGAWDAPAHAQGRLAARIGGLIEAWRQTDAYVVAVSDETGMGIVPETASGRLFRDELGRLNQLLAAESEEVTLVVAGRAVPLPP